MNMCMYLSNCLTKNVAVESVCQSRFKGKKVLYVWNKNKL